MYRTYRTVRTVRKRRMRLAVPGGGLLTFPLGLAVLMVVIIGTVFGGAEAERQAAASCGQQAPGLEEYDGPPLPGSEDYTPSFILNPRDIAQVAGGAGFVGDDLVTAVAVARAESGGHPSAINTKNANGSTDYGLWQINSVHIGSGFDPARYRDPAYNALWAYRVFEAAGKQWSPWTVYKTGKYREFLPMAQAAVEDLGAGAVDDLPSDSGDGLTGAEECPREMAVASNSVGGPNRTASISGRAGPAIAFARQQLGDPYQWGAIGPDSWDCSSLVQAAWATAGVRLPRVSRDQFAAVTPVPRFDIHPGDLIFYGNPVVRHVVMYTGNGKIIEAPSAGLTVRERDVYWTDVRGVGRPAAS